MNEIEQSSPDDELLVPSLGAVLFASDEPVPPRELSQAFGGLPVEQIERALGELEAHFERSPSGLRLERVAGGVRLATRSEVAPWVRRFFRQRNKTRLSVAALETLAIIAYRQPITAPEIQAIRGRDPAGALKGLLDKKLVRILGRKRVLGNPLLYGTSREFLIHFGLNGLDDLPSIEEFDQFLEVLGAGEALPGEQASGDDVDGNVDGDECAVDERFDAADADPFGDLADIEPSGHA